MLCYNKSSIPNSAIVTSAELTKSKGTCSLFTRWTIVNSVFALALCIRFQREGGTGDGDVERRSATIVYGVCTKLGREEVNAIS